MMLRSLVPNLVQPEQAFVRLDDVKAQARLLGLRGQY
jgi:hypothetical protein